MAEAAPYADTIAPRDFRLQFGRVGLWSRYGTLRLYTNPKPGFVSRSTANMHNTGSFYEAEVRTVESMMGELGHSHGDLLKIRIEGSEYEVLGAMPAQWTGVGVLCVEFARPHQRLHPDTFGLSRKLGPGLPASRCGH